MKIRLQAANLITDVERHNITNNDIIYRNLNSSTTSNNLKMTECEEENKFHIQKAD